MLKDKAQPIVVDELTSRIDEVDENQEESCAIFDDALAAFRKQPWMK
jgi:hypothetical protein